MIYGGKMGEHLCRMLKKAILVVFETREASFVSGFGRFTLHE
jgi:hypothetical protein